MPPWAPMPPPRTPRPRGDRQADPQADQPAIRAYACPLLSLRTARRSNGLRAPPGTGLRSKPPASGAPAFGYTGAFGAAAMLGLKINNYEVKSLLGGGDRG